MHPQSPPVARTCWVKWPEIGERHSAAGDDDRLSSLDLPQDGSGVVAKLPKVMILLMPGSVALGAHRIKRRRSSRRSVERQETA